MSFPHLPLLALGFALLAFADARAQEERPRIVVLLDRAKVVNLSQVARQLVLGNPIIADVALLRGGRQMVLTGKGYGETNLMIIDAKGTLVEEALIKVEAADDATVVLQSGLERQTFSCAPHCAPTLTLGDTTGFESEVAGQEQNRNDANGSDAPKTPGSKGGAL